MALSATKFVATILLLASTACTVRSEPEEASAQLLRGRGRLLDDSIPEKNPRIIGGQASVPGRFPYYALMNGSNLCGAVLISPRFVLTAAHCQDADLDFAVDSISRRVGKEIGIVDRAVHPLYDDFTYSNDIAMFELSEDATNEDGTPSSYVRLSPEEIDLAGTSMTVVGYGDIDPDEEITRFSETLHRVDVKYVSNAECNRDHRGEIDDEMMCAEDDGKDACYGDSGGPLLLTPNENDFNEDMLVGIVSWGRGCADKQFPGVYTRISYFYDWIVGTMCVLNAQKAPPYVDCAAILGIDVTDNVDNREEELPQVQEEVVIADVVAIEESPPPTEPPQQAPPTTAPVATCGSRGGACALPADCCSGRCNLFSRTCYPPTDGNRDRISTGMGGSASGLTERTESIAEDLSP